MYVIKLKNETNLTEHDRKQVINLILFKEKLKNKINCQKIKKF